MCRALFILSFAAVSLCFPQNTPYYSITGPCNLRFPQDHGSHPGYRTEWWYYTGNLQDDSGGRYGFQLTFFRSQISPPGAENTWPSPASAWRTQQIFLAHSAVSDIGAGRFHHAEQMSRDVLGMAGVRDESGFPAVFVKDWSVRIGPQNHTLTAHTNDFAFDLNLTPKKGPVLHGNLGYSMKGEAPQSASCYYSMTRLEAEGALRIGAKSIPVRGSAWMDHEFSSAPLESDLVGWDWLSLQLSNNTELMIYLLRREDGTFSPASSGTFVDARGRSMHLSKEMFDIRATDQWKSPHTGALYPSGWLLHIDSPKMELQIVPGLKDQEMQSPSTTGVTYWEGSVSADGSTDGEKLSGVGYVELTGYAHPLDSRL